MKTRQITHGTTLTAAITLVAVLLMAAANAVADVSVSATLKISTHPKDDLQVWIWPDRGEGGIYSPGDDIRMFVETTRDCFLILYNIDTRGRLNILFPYDPWDDNFVPGGTVVEFPRRYDSFDWTVDGPPGIEYVQAIASEFPISPPDWPVYLRTVNGRDAVYHDADLRDFWAGDDRLGYIRTVNRKIARRYWNWCATDLASFEVRPRRFFVNINVNVFDPWPDVFYGEIFIGWPIGGRIYVDGDFVGCAPIRIPRRHWGAHEIICYDGPRVVRRHTVHVRPKTEYYAQDVLVFGKPGHVRRVVEYGHAKAARRGIPDEVRTDQATMDVIRKAKATTRSKIDAVSRESSASARKEWTNRGEQSRDTRVEQSRTARGEQGRSTRAADRRELTEQSKTTTQTMERVTTRPEPTRQTESKDRVVVKSQKSKTADSKSSGALRIDRVISKTVKSAVKVAKSAGDAAKSAVDAREFKGKTNSAPRANAPTAERGQAKSDRSSRGRP
jgi:hypothetical protein